jgi:hypothetical protein
VAARLAGGPARGRGAAEAVSLHGRRGWSLGWAGLGWRLLSLNAAAVSVPFCIRGLWQLGFAALAVAVLTAAWWFAASWVTAWRDASALLREVCEPPPVPRPRGAGPPWVTAEMPVMHDVACPAMSSMMPDGPCRCGVRAAAVPLP